MKHVKSFSGTLSGATISNEFMKYIKRQVILTRMIEVAKQYNEANSAYEITKKKHLRKAMKLKIETLYKSYQWLQISLNKIDEVTQ